VLFAADSGLDIKANLAQLFTIALVANNGCRLRLANAISRTKAPALNFLFFAFAMTAPPV
jgi:hypothetical protein